METPSSSQKCFPSPSPSPHSVLFGRTEDSCEFFGGKATLIVREREGIVVVSDYHSQSSQSFQSVSTVLSEIVAQAITFLPKREELQPGLNVKRRDLFWLKILFGKGSIWLPVYEPSMS